jgi:hypothetical protein
LVPALGLPIVVGGIAVRAARAGGGSGRASRILDGCLAVGLGLGLASCGFFVAMAILGSSRWAPMIGDLGLLGLAVTILAGRRRRSAGAADSARTARPATPDSGGAGLLRAAVVLAALAALGAFALASWLRPHGEWDAWAVWNLRARFLFEGGEHWRDAFSALLAWSRPDHPQMLPALVARGWGYVGRATVVVPAVVALFFTFATVLLVGSAVATGRGEIQGLLAALVLLGSPRFTAHGSAQYADIPLGFFMAATLVLLWQYDRQGRSHPGTVALAGTMVGLAAWTKNEGLVFATALALGRLALRLAVIGWRGSLRELGAFAGGAVPVLAVVASFKLALAPPSYMTEDWRLPLLVARLTDGARYAVVGRALGTDLLTLGGWAVSVLALLAAYALLVGARIEPEDRAPLAASVVTLALVLAGYVAVYLFLPLELEWHLRASLPRLLLQLWPSWVFVYWLVVRPLGPADRRIR